MHDNRWRMRGRERERTKRGEMEHMKKERCGFGRRMNERDGGILLVSRTGTVMCDIKKETEKRDVRNEDDGT